MLANLDEVEFVRLIFFCTGPSSSEAFIIWDRFSHKITSHPIGNEVSVRLDTFVGCGVEIFFSSRENFFLKSRIFFMESRIISSIRTLTISRGFYPRVEIFFFF